MNRVIVAVGVFAVAISSAVCQEGGNKLLHTAGENNKLSNLRCEYLKDPLCIDAAQPQLSWVIEEIFSTGFTGLTGLAGFEL